MPVTRRDDEQDPLDRYIEILWNRKWIIIGAALASGILTYCALLFVKESFRVTAEIFVNRIPAASEEQTPNPETVTSLLKSQAVLEKVRDDFAKTFNVSPPPKIEGFARQFDVKSYILQDTTVQKQYSPILSLQVEAVGTSESRYIMDSWIRHFIDDFGNYTTQEAINKRQAYLKEKIKLEQQIAELEVEQSEYDAQLPLAKRILAEKLDLLSPSQLQLGETGESVKMDIRLQNQRLQNGLLERYSELKLAMQNGTAGSTAATELAALEISIQDTKTSIAEAQSILAELRSNQLKTARQLTQLTDIQKSVNEAVGRFTVASAIYKETYDAGLPAGGDIRALTSPVMPETKIWPKRSIVAGLVAIAAAILTACLILARNFLTRLSNRSGQ